MGPPPGGHPRGRERPRWGAPTPSGTHPAGLRPGQWHCADPVCPLCVTPPVPPPCTPTGAGEGRGVGGDVKHDGGAGGAVAWTGGYGAGWGVVGATPRGSHHTATPAGRLLLLPTLTVACPRSPPGPLGGGAGPQPPEHGGAGRGAGGPAAPHRCHPLPHPARHEEAPAAAADGRPGRAGHREAPQRGRGPPNPPPAPQNITPHSHPLCTPNLPQISNTPPPQNIPLHPKTSPPQFWTPPHPRTLPQTPNFPQIPNTPCTPKHPLHPQTPP